MDQNTTDQIENIIQNLEFVGKDLLRVSGNDMMYQFNHSGGEQESELLQGLTNVIYSEFYCAGNEVKATTPTHEDRITFVKQLRAANSTKEKLHPAWKVESKLPDGKIYAIKGNYRYLVSPGDYIRSSMSDVVKAGSEIKIFQHSEYDNKEEEFFYIFGETIAETAAPGLGRFYFNLKPEGGIVLVKNISTYFNQYKIPFQFKCLNQPAYYNRTDSAVLYISKNYADFAMEIMAKFYDEVKPFLNNEVPYFTKRLTSGISFAENPPQENESFGQSRSKIIAEAIVKAHDRQDAKANWMNSINQNIKTKGMSLEHFYLNSNSHYPYQFPVFQ